LTKEADEIILSDNSDDSESDNNVIEKQPQKLEYYISFFFFLFSFSFSYFIKGSSLLQ